MVRNRSVTIEESKEMEMEMVPDQYMDIISGEFAYDPVRLPLEQDTAQLLYDRKTLQTIWEIERHARNPFTRQWFDIKSAIPQTELRKEMKHFVELHRFPAKAVIAEYSKILNEREMKQHLVKLRECVKQRLIIEKQWVKIWKKMNIIRLFCEFHSQNIELFISLRGFRYLKKVIRKTLREKDAKEAALDVGKEIVRAIDVIINGLRSRGQNSMGILGNFEKRQSVILSLIDIVGHVYNNNKEYTKIQSLVLRAFSSIFNDISIDIDINESRKTRTAVLVGYEKTITAVLVGYRCALNILCQTDAKDISSEDLNHGIAILRTVTVTLVYFRQLYNQVFVRALGNAVIICISREIERSKELSGFREGQLLEAQMQAENNSEALAMGVRLVRDIIMAEDQLATRVLGRGLDIVKDLVHMFEVYTQMEDEDEVGNRESSLLICENNCRLIQCVHYRIARDVLDINEAISRKRGPLLNVEVLRKFISDRTRIRVSVVSVN
jgi:hypothetical protein